MFKPILLLIAATCGMGTVLHAQEALELTLQQTIHHAQEKSPDAQSARHSFRSSYWNYPATASVPPTGTIATTEPTTCPT